MNKKNHKRAFTLTELIIVISVIAILAAVMIPSLIGYIKKARISNDQITVGQLNSLIQLKNLDEENINYDTINEIYQESYGKSLTELEPASAQYGYHFWYEETSKKVVLLTTNELQEKVNGRQNLSTTNNQKTLREQLFDGYILLDGKGSELANVLTLYNDVSSEKSYKRLYQSLKTIEEDKYDKDLYSNVNNIFNSTVFITDEGNFANNLKSTSYQIQSDIKYLTNTKTIIVLNENTFSTKTYMNSEYEFLVEELDNNFVVPKTIEYISSNSLNIEFTNTTKNYIIVEVNSLEELSNKVDIAFTNCLITYLGSNSLYNLTENGTCITSISEEVTDDFAYIVSPIKVESFEVNIVGLEHNDANIYSIALNRETEQLNLEVSNFKVTLGENQLVGIFPNTNVIWSVNSVSEIASITSNGLLTINGTGEVTVIATSQQTPETTVTCTIRVGGVTNIAANFIGDCLSIVDGQTRKVTIEKGKTATFSFDVIISKNFFDIVVDETYIVVTNSDQVAIDFDNKTITVFNHIEKGFTLTFISKNNISKTYTFVTNEIITEFDAIESTLEYQDKFLYKVGNINEVKLSQMWKYNNTLIENNGYTIEDIYVTYEITDSKTNRLLDASKYNLTENDIQFNMQGVVKIDIIARFKGTNEIIKTITIPLEVLNGYNVYSYDDLVSQKYKNSNKMILNNIDINAYSHNIIVDGTILYGNSFKLDGTIATKPAEMTWEALIKVKDAIVDNVYIIGQTFPKITWYQEAYSGYTLYLDGSHCEVYNSYVYGSRAAIYVGCDSTIENTTLEGGVLANAILDCKNITLNNVTTIQNVESTNENITEDNLPCGLGLFVDATFANLISITLEGDFRQYNWINSSLVDKIEDSTYRTILKSLLNKYASTFGYEINSDTYINAGIVLMSEKMNDNVFIDNREESLKQKLPYDLESASALGTGGSIITLSIPNDKTSLEQGNYIISEYRFNSNDYNRILESISTIPNVSLNASSIDTTLNPTINGNILNIDLENNTIFTITNEMFSVYHYGNQLTDAVTILNPTMITKDSPRNVEIIVKVSYSESYDINGNFIMIPMSKEYNFTIHSELATLKDPIISENSSYGDNHYGYISTSGCDPDYKTAAHFLDGLKIWDYDANGNYIEMDFSDCVELPENMKIMSFKGGSMSNADQYELKVSNNKLYIESIGASPVKRIETMEITIEYRGSNGKTIEIIRTYNFTSSTGSF